MDLAHLCDADAGNPQHLDQPGRHFLAQLVEHRGPAGVHELAHDFQRRLADPVDPGKRAGARSLGEVSVVAGDRPGGVLEGANPEGIVPFQGERGRDLLEHLSYDLLVHWWAT